LPGFFSPTEHSQAYFVRSAAEGCDTLAVPLTCVIRSPDTGRCPSRRCAARLPARNVSTGSDARRRPASPPRRSIRRRGRAGRRASGRLHVDVQIDAIERRTRDARGRERSTESGDQFGARVAEVAARALETRQVRPERSSLSSAAPCCAPTASRATASTSSRAASSTSSRLSRGRKARQALLAGLCAGRLGCKSQQRDAP
jgi:hypothetical protein